ncbi:hypothetical protein ACFL59_14650 [Planctomycetota bacterium]
MNSESNVRQILAEKPVPEPQRVTIASSGKPYPRSKKAGLKKAKPTDFASLDQHQRWKCSQGFKKGRFVYVKDTVGGGILLVGNEKKGIAKKYMELLEPHGPDVIKGKYTFDGEKSESQWSFEVEEFGPEIAGLPENRRSERIRDQLAAWFAGGHELEGKRPGQLGDLSYWFHSKKLADYAEKEGRDAPLRFAKGIHELFRMADSGASEEALSTEFAGVAKYLVRDKRGDAPITLPPALTAPSAEGDGTVPSDEGPRCPACKEGRLVIVERFRPCGVPLLVCERGPPS